MDHTHLCLGCPHGIHIDMCIRLHIQLESNLAGNMEFVVFVFKGFFNNFFLRDWYNFIDKMILIPIFYWLKS